MTTFTGSVYTPEVEADNPDDSTGAFLSKPFPPEQQHSYRELRLPLSPQIDHL